jgi:hypothetical protein
MPSKCPKMPFLGGYWGYFTPPSIRLKIAQNSPVLGGTSRVIAKGVKSCLESPKNSLKNRWFLPFFGVWQICFYIGFMDIYYPKSYR